MVVQLTSAGADKWRKAIVAGLLKATGCARIYERSDSEVRGLEGLKPTVGWLHGEAPAGGLSIDENGQGRIRLAGGGEYGFYYATNGVVTKKVVVGNELKPGMYVEFAIGLEGIKGYYNNTKHLQLVTDATLVDGKY